MLFEKDLDKIVYERHKLVKCDDIVIVSGYVGPDPIKKISSLPLPTTIVYGMYGCDGIGQGLHNTLIEEDAEYNNISIFYSTIPVHSKLYMWRYKGEVVHALIGSANFSTNGLTTPYKETLAETTADTFAALDAYYKLIKQRCIRCTDAVVTSKRQRKQLEEKFYDPDVCSMPLYIIENGKEVIPEKSGLNWGMAKLTGSHVNINDAYIPIPAELVNHYPDMFPVKQTAPTNLEGVSRKDHRDNDSVDIIWDDGTTMTGLLEGSRKVKIDGVSSEYPKQIGTTPSKALLGKYLRERIGVPEGKPITMSDLEKYGRKTIDVTLQGEGIYYFDFSNK